MTHSYRRGSLLVLAFLGVLSAVMSVLSVALIFQLRASMKDSPSFVSSEVTAVLLPVCTVLSAFSLTLNLSSVLVCLLHSYFTNEIHRETQDTHRADWFLLDSRTVRHVAVGLFCFGVSVYLAAMSIYMLLVFEVKTGVASVCVLSFGVLILLLLLIHSLILAARAGKRFRNDHAHILYHNNPSSRPGCHTSNLNLTDSPWRQHSLAALHAHFAHPAIADPNQKPQKPASSGPHVHTRDKSSYGGGGSGWARHTLSGEPGLFYAQAKPWNGGNREMRSILARKATIKDSTLV